VFVDPQGGRKYFEERAQVTKQVIKSLVDAGGILPKNLVQLR